MSVTSLKTPASNPLTLAEFSPDDLSIDRRVQRTEGVSEVRVAEIAANFNPAAIGTLTVSHRASGQNIILDGAHRVAAARLVGYADKLPAIVHTGLTLQQEAEMFLLLNDFKSPSSITRFKVRVVQGDPVAVEINRIIQEHGWHVNGAAKTTAGVAAVGALEQIYRNGGGSKPAGAHPQLLNQVFEVITAAWEHDADSAHGSIILGVAQLYGRLGPAVDTKKLISEMSQTRPIVLIGKAKTLRDIQGGSIPAAMAKVLAGLHNYKRRSNLLPEWVWVR